MRRVVRPRSPVGLRRIVLTRRGVARPSLVRRCRDAPLDRALRPIEAVLDVAQKVEKRRGVPLRRRRCRRRHEIVPHRRVMSGRVRRHRALVAPSQWWFPHRACAARRCPPSKARALAMQSSLRRRPFAIGCDALQSDAIVPRRSSRGEQRHERAAGAPVPPSVSGRPMALSLAPASAAEYARQRLKSNGKNCIWPTLYFGRGRIAMIAQLAL